MSRRDQHFPLKNSYPVINFYSEGAVTEPKYLSDLSDFLLQQVTDFERRRRIKAQIKVSQTHSQDAESLVNQAIENRISPDDVAVVIIDEDDRTSSKEINNRNNAIDKAYQNGIRFVYSVPCFEFWALLHFCCSDRYLSKDECIGKLPHYMKSYNHRRKKLRFNFNDLASKQEFAIQNAKNIIHRHSGGKSYKGIDLENPTTNAFIIIEELKKFIENFPQ